MDKLQPLFSALAILGKEPPPIESHGMRFYTEGAFTLFALLQSIPPKGPVPWKALGEYVGKVSPVNPRIVIAEPPDDMTPRLLRALIGGVYHECFHVLYSWQQPLNIKLIQSIWFSAGIPQEDWSILHPYATIVHNLIEDIRIERKGLGIGPGVEDKLHALAGFILDLEHEAASVVKKRRPQDVALVLFRERGFDYPESQEEVAQLTLEYPDVAHHVDQHKALISEVQNLSQDPYQNFKITLRVLREILLPLLKAPPPEPPSAASGKSSKGSMPEPGKGQGGNKQDKKGPPQKGDSGEPQDSGETQDPGKPHDKDGKPSTKGPLHEGSDQGDGVKTFFSSQEALTSEFLNLWSRIHQESKPEEYPWHPFSTTNDQHILMSEGRDISKVLKEVRQGASYLTARLSSLFQAYRDDQIVCGTPDGEFDPEELIPSWVKIRSGAFPYNPFFAQGDEINTSVACLVLMDQSGSMTKPFIESSIQSALMIGEVMESIGGVTYFLGYTGEGPSLQPPYSRTNSVTYYHYKDWQDDWRSCRARLSGLFGFRATPTGDALHQGFSLIQNRPERYKLIICLTDGQPHDHAVTLWMSRKIQEQGIGLVGVGLGVTRVSLERFFPLVVSEDDVKDTASSLALVLSSLLTGNVLRI